MGGKLILLQISCKKTDIPHCNHMLRHTLESDPFAGARGAEGRAPLPPRPPLPPLMTISLETFAKIGGAP
jgi:hypothetical protein